MVIVMPKGGYALDFLIRRPETPVEPINSGESPSAALALPAFSGEIVTPGLPVLALRRHRQFSLGLAVALVLASTVALYWYFHDANLRKRLDTGPLTFPFAALLNDHSNALIVTSDTGLLQTASLLHRRISLDEYVTRSYSGGVETNPPDLARNWSIYQFTDGREMAVAGLLLSRNALFAGRIFLRSGHAVQLQDFKGYNIILIGSPISNPWAQFYEDKLNFRCDWPGAGFILFHNKSPRANESEQYPNVEDIQHHRAYARIVFLPQTAAGASTLLIAGTTAQSTQAAGELLADQAALASTLRGMNIDPFGPPRFFELLIRSSNFVGGAIMPEVVAWRLANAPER
jgi:hypothetical protein